MAHVNQFFAERSRARTVENNYDLITSVRQRCSCCPYGFHVDNSFVNYTESMKKGKGATIGPIIHGGKPVHLLPNPAPDLHLPYESHSYNGSVGDDSHDSFAVFGTTTGRRKKHQTPKLSSDYATLSRSASSHGRILDISMPNNNDNRNNNANGSSKGRSLSAMDQINANAEAHLHTNAYSETRHLVTEMNPEPCKDPHCPENHAHTTVCCSNLSHCCHDTTTCLECCDDVFCQSSDTAPTPRMDPPDAAGPLHPKEAPVSVFPSPPETAKVEMDAERVKEIREYMLKCVNHIRLLEERVGQVPVLNARLTAMREENSLLKTRLTAKTQTVTQLTLQLENAQNRMQRQLKLFNAGAQTDSLEEKAAAVQKASLVEKGTSPAKDFDYLTAKASQTLTDPLEVDDEMPRASASRQKAAPARPHGDVRETYIPPLEDMPLSRDRLDGRRPVDEVIARSRVERKEASQFFRPRCRDTGVGGHDVREIYCLDPKRLRLEDLPVELENLLKGRWEASLPKKPRLVNLGIDHTPQWRHKTAQATPKLTVTGVGEHDVDRVYFVDPREMSADELPPALVRRMKADWEAALPPKPPVASLGVSAVVQWRSQGMMAAPEMQEVALGRHDVGALYSLLPEALRTAELPPEGVAALRKEWEEAQPKPPSKEVVSVQCEPPQTVNQSAETERPRLCSMGVGDHSVNRLYFQEYEQVCEEELPIEAFTTFREAWREEWERCLPPKPKLVSSSVSFSLPKENKLISTEPRRMTNCGVGDRDVSKIYFLERPKDLEAELPSKALQQLEEVMYERVRGRMPKKPTLMDSSVVCHNPVGTRSVGIGDHEVDQLYFLSPHRASALDLPLQFLNVIRSEWTQEIEEKKPSKMELLTSATSITDLVGTAKNVGTMSEEPRTAMFDESVGVNLDEEEWESLEESDVAWSPRHGPWNSKKASAGTSLKVVIEKLRHSYRFNKAEFVGHLARLVAREVKSRESQTENEMSESFTEYESNPNEPPKTLVHRGVSDDTINVDVVVRSLRISCGTQNRPVCFDKITYTDNRRTFSRAVITDKIATRDRCINYESPLKPRDAACGTERVRTRDVFVWAELLKPKSHSDTPILQDSLPPREEGGRHEHYLVSRGDSRGSSVSNEPVGCSPEDVRTKGTVLGGHSHTHVHGADPAAASGPKSPQWPNRGSSPRSSTSSKVPPPPPSRGSSSLELPNKGEPPTNAPGGATKPTAASAEAKPVPVQTGASKVPPPEPAAIVVSDDDSVFTLHQPRGQGRSARIFSSSSSSSPGSGKGRTSKISPRSIMKKASEEEDSGSNTLLKKKKGIRFAKDTKRKKTDGVFLRSDSVSSSSFSEDENETEEEGCYEMSIVQKLQDLRADGASANTAILRQSNLSSAMQSCCKTIAEWMTDSTKFTSKQMNEAVSTLRKEWFAVSSGRRATPEQTRSYLAAFEQFSPTLLDMVVNLADDNGNTALHYAISREQWTIVRSLMETNRARLNRANKAGYTPVMLAALCREVGASERPLMQMLLASGHINQGSSPAGQTALMLAASHGRVAMLQMLLDSGADPNRRDREASTALMCACEHGHLEAVRKLLAVPTCDPNVTDNDGSTALSIALENKHRDIALLIYARTNLKDNVATRLLDFRSTQF